MPAMVAVAVLGRMRIVSVLFPASVPIFMMKAEMLLLNVFFRKNAPTDMNR